MRARSVATTPPEEHLRRAVAARSPSTRARHAQRGLATPGALDPGTHAMLLRQLYLAHFEQRRFDQAHEVALQAVSLEVMEDVMLQDAARAAAAAGNLDACILHLRTAAKVGPSSRRPFHLWTLGSLLFLAHRYPEAIAALGKAARGSAREVPLYKAHLALAQVADGEIPDDLQATVHALASSPSGQGYGRFVLGHLAYAAGEWPAARKYLEAFVRRTSTARPAMAVALEPELRMARATLAKITTN